MGDSDIPPAIEQAVTRQAGRSILARYSIVAIGFIGSVVIARALQADGRGAYAYLIALTTTAMSVGHMSIEAAFVQRWDRDAHDSLFGASLLIALMAGSVAALATGALEVTGLLTLPAGAPAAMLVVALATLPFLLASLYANAVLTNQGRIDRLNSIALVTAVLQVAVLLGLASLDLLTVSSVIVVWAISTVFPLALQVPSLLRAPGIARPRFGTLRGLIRVGLRYHLGSVALALILRVDILILAPRVDVAQVGIYSLAVTLAELAGVAANAAAQAGVTHQLGVSTEDHRVVAFTASLARTTLIIAVFLLVGLLLIAPFAVTAVFGPSFEGTTIAIVCLAPGIVGLALQRPIGLFLTRLERPAYFSAAMAIGLGANVLMNLALIPRLGIVGAGLASSLSYVGIGVWASVWFLNATDAEPSDLVPRTDDLRRLMRGWSRR